jgi:hypothetical protein
MMALMVLGMPPVYSCYVTAGCGVPQDAGISEPRICPSIGSGREIGILATKEELGTGQWRRLPAVHCMAMQSSLSFMCGLDGLTRKVKYEKFRQPCGVQPTACWDALKSGRLRVGEAELPHNDEPDQEPHGRRGRMFRKLQDASHSPGKKNSSGTHGGPGGRGLDLVEHREEPGGHQVRQGDHHPPRRGSHSGRWAAGMEARR